MHNILRIEWFGWIVLIHSGILFTTGLDLERDLNPRTAGLRVRRAEHSAVSNRKTVEGTVKKNENETYRLLGHNAFIFFLPCSMLWSRADSKKNKLLKQLSEATTNCKPRDCKRQLQPSLIFNCVNAHNLLYYCWITFFHLRHLYKLVKAKRSFLSQNTFYSYY